MYLSLTIDEYIKRNEFFIENSKEYLAKIKAKKCISKSAYELSRYKLKIYLEIEFLLNLLKEDTKTSKAEKFNVVNKFMEKMDFDLTTLGGFINGAR